jgi:hypothetical protein
LNSCSLENIIALGEVDKVQIVKKNTSYAQYRAYFTRTQLKPIKKNQKYLYFYNKKKKDLAVLLHRNNQYILYSLYHPKAPHQTFYAHKHTHYRDIKKLLRKQGYLLSSPHAVGATSKVGLRKYKGIKTLLIEIKDYSTLQKKYKKAIRSYDASSILKLKSKPPHILIANYFKTYQKKASTDEQKKQLRLIANKLHLHSPKIQHNYEKNKIQNVLTNDEQILKESSLEELIAHYKTNKNPKYKQRILELMKEAQQ